MTDTNALAQALSGMIFSHSGWRGVFAASGDEEDRNGKISAAHRIIAAVAASVFAAYLNRKNPAGAGKPLALVGRDTRPTGKAIAETVVATLQAAGCDVRYAGVTAAPEMMAWARSLDGSAAGKAAITGFMYISASHNPIGHNGFKFGLSDGGVLSAQAMAELASAFHALFANEDSPIFNSPWSPYPPCLREMQCGSVKKEAYNAYFNFCGEVAFDANAAVAENFRRGSTERPIGVCCDFNGSARCASIDRDFLGSWGMRFAAINARPGAIVHRIVPEGGSLEPCRLFLETQHRRDPAFVMGYVPDCDGDRGNVVIWDEALQKARALEAQEVFALACAAELAQLAWIGALCDSKTAIAVNDPTSLRIDRIAEAFGVSVFRAEVGEANVVGLARRLREEGYTVRILGEGSAGGNITHPSAVRDPLHTVLALAKLLSLRTVNNKAGLFELWCNASGQAQRYHPDFSLADIIASLPPFVSTGAYSPEALLNVTSADHCLLKSRYQNIFLREWEERKDELKTHYGIYSWQAAAYNGMEERRHIANFGEAGKGGLKICFHDAGGKAIASIWMRGSATEPVFRVMADAQSSRLERVLIEWQRRMTTEADRS